MVTVMRPQLSHRLRLVELYKNKGDSQSHHLAGALPLHPCIELRREGYKFKPVMSSTV